MVKRINFMLRISRHSFKNFKSLLFQSKIKQTKNKTSPLGGIGAKCSAIETEDRCHFSGFLSLVHCPCASIAALKLLAVPRGLRGKLWVWEAEHPCRPRKMPSFPHVSAEMISIHSMTFWEKNYIKAIFLSAISGPCLSHSLPSEVLALLMRAFNALHSQNPTEFFWDGD